VGPATSDVARVEIVVRRSWQQACIDKVMTIRLLWAFLGVLFLASMGTFFLTVPLPHVATVVCIMAGLMLMFGVAVQVGNRG
jgi:hypothetical protein